MISSPTQQLSASASQKLIDTHGASLYARRMTRRPEVFADDAFQFSLRVKRTQEEQDDFYFPSDDGTVGRFLTWIYENEIPQFRGSGSGPGYCYGVFPADQKDVILQWCIDEGLINDVG
jgi:hypothetical protein